MADGDKYPAFFAYDDAELSVLVGKTLTACYRLTDDDRIIFITADGSDYILFHKQDCCESVSIDDICGDLDDLVGSPILVAEGVKSDDPAFTKAKNEDDDSWTWTFYKFGTIKGSVTMRWYGASNGYYSERADFVKVRS